MVSANKVSSDSGLSKCLVVDDEQDLRELISGIIESEFGLYCEVSDSGFDAINLLKKQGSQFEFIVCDFNMPNGNGGEVLNYITRELISVPFIFCCSEKPKNIEEKIEEGSVFFVEKPFFILGLKQEVKKILNNSKKLSIQQSSSNLNILNSESVSNNTIEYTKVRKKLIYSLVVAPCDIFIKLGSDRFILFFRNETILNTSDIQRVMDKKIDSLYILKKDLNNFYETLLAKYYIESKNNINENYYIEYLNSIQENCHEIFSEIGFNDDLKQLVIKNINLALKLFSKNQYFEALLKKYSINNKYTPGHSVLNCFVSSWIAHKIKWDSEKNIESLTFASLLHDLTLNNDKLAIIKTEKELIEKKSQFTHEEFLAWKTHAEDSAKISSLFTEIPYEVHSILLQHHKYYEMFDGSESIKNNRITFSPLSALFIISHHLTDYIMQNELDSITYEVIKESFNDNFFMEPFKQILKILLSEMNKAD